MANVKLSELSKYYGKNLAVDNISVEIMEGEFFSLLGPSGCGKSTTLRMIAGFEETEIGSIEIDGVDVSGLLPEQREIGFVFQNYAIFPHMNVYDNIAFGLRLRKLSANEIDSRVRAALEQVGMTGFENRYQKEMSGGQQQRVALARVLVTEPRILLLDEPLSALDKNLREEMKFWIKDLQSSLGITTIYVTHDQGEALTMSDRIAVMNEGRIAQIGTPEEIYEHPTDRFVTEFIGESNILRAKVAAVSDTGCELDIDGQTVSAPVRDGILVSADTILALRPERVLVGEKADKEGWNSFELPIKKVTYQGPFVRFLFALGTQELIAEVANRQDMEKPDPGTKAWVSWQSDSGRIIAE
ncbi:MAG: ABC transporter ATP-binding protein [Alphaproteobacteria bacterium]|nr:ABC transporter ATP-binding protein [Alphaproteobacteria bacterium]